MDKPLVFKELEGLFGDTLDFGKDHKEYRPPLYRWAADPALHKAVAELRLADIKDIWKSFELAPIKHANKEFYSAALSALLSWPNSQEYEVFSKRLAPWLQEALAIGAYEPFIDVRELERKHGQKLFEKNRKSYYMFDDVVSLHPSLAAFTVVGDHHITLNHAIRLALKKVIPEPATLHPKPIPQAPGTTVWSVENELFASIELALRLIHTFAENDAGAKTSRGVNKSTIKTWRANSGYASFPIAGRLGLDALDLMGRFLSALSSHPPKNPPDDVPFYIKNKIIIFLEQKALNYFQAERVGYELDLKLFSDHIRRSPGYRDFENSASAARMAFESVIKKLAKQDAWYLADELAHSCLMRDKFIAHFARTLESELITVNVQSLQVGTDQYQTVYIHDTVPLSGDIIERIFYQPLIKGYCYLLAAFGLLDICEQEPEKIATRNGKKEALCPYDALYAIRVTPLGRYCLGITDAKPQPPPRVFEAIADAELPVVTYRGNSAERKLFLSDIGESLGPELFRISDASFTSHCTSLAEIEATIKNFKRLVDPNPAPHWQELFNRALAKFAALKTPEPAYLFPAPSDPALLNDLLNIPGMRELVLRVEGGYLAVKYHHTKRFVRLARSAGFRLPDVAT